MASAQPSRQGNHDPVYDVPTGTKDSPRRTQTKYGEGCQCGDDDKYAKKNDSATGLRLGRHPREIIVLGLLSINLNVPRTARRALSPPVTPCRVSVSPPNSLKGQLVDLPRGSYIRESESSAMAEELHPVPLVKSLLAGDFDGPAEAARIGSRLERLMECALEKATFDELCEPQNRRSRRRGHGPIRGGTTDVQGS